MDYNDYKTQAQNCAEIAQRFARDRSDQYQTIIEGDSMTKQADAEDADINNIIKRYTPEAAIAAFAMRPGQYMDVSDAPDYHRAVQLVQTAAEGFAALPAEVRSRFANDPGQLIDAIYDPDRAEELTQLGIFAKPTEEPTQTQKAPTPETPPAETTTKAPQK